MSYGLTITRGGEPMDLDLTVEQAEAMQRLAVSLMGSSSMSLGESMIHAERFAVSCLCDSPLKWKGGGSFPGASDVERLFTSDVLKQHDAKKSQEKEALADD